VAKTSQRALFVIVMLRIVGGRHCYVVDFACEGRLEYERLFAGRQPS